MDTMREFKPSDERSAKYLGLGLPLADDLLVYYHLYIPRNGTIPENYSNDHSFLCKLDTARLPPQGIPIKCSEIEETLFCRN